MVPELSKIFKCASQVAGCCLQAGVLGHPGVLQGSVGSEAASGVYDQQLLDEILCPAHHPMRVNH
jgi:hypothetical protein